MAENEDKTESPKGDPKKAKAFLERAETCMQSRQYDYAIEMFLQGLQRDPENAAAHDALRRCGLVRAQNGGKKAGMMDQMKRMRGNTPLQQMLNAEFLLARDPDNNEWMDKLTKAAHKGGYQNVLGWILPIYLESLKKKPQQKSFLMLCDMFAELEQYAEAVTACESALAISPKDLDLQTKLKNLSARLTMQKGKYEGDNSFRDSIQDADAQAKLQEQDRVVKSEDALDRAISDARKEHELNPKVAGKLMRLVDALLKREREAEEDEAVTLLEDSFAQSKQFAFKMRSDEIRIKQMRRHARMLLNAHKETPEDNDLKRQAGAKAAELLRFELKAHELWCKQYPTDMRLRYEYGRRLFTAKQYDKGIEVLQHAQNDPKYRVPALNLLGLCFYAKDGFKQEAIDTFKRALDQYELDADETSKELRYNLGRAHEESGQIEEAIAEYSKVAQWDYNYRDVRGRIEKLRKETSEN